MHETHFCEKTHGDDSRRDIINKDVLCIICSKTRSGDIRMINIEISDDFDLKKIAESGQCFRWQPIENDGYRIIHGGSCLCIWKNESVEKSVKSIKQFDENDNRKSSKAGIDGITKSLAKELGPSNIRVNSIAPGYIDTDMNKHFSSETVNEIKNEIPLHRIGTPHSIAQCVKWLVDDDYTTGQVICVDGGWSII